MKLTPENASDYYYELGTFYSNSNLDRVKTQPGETDSSQPLVSDQEKITRQEGKKFFHQLRALDQESAIALTSADSLNHNNTSLSPHSSYKMRIINRSSSTLSKRLLKLEEVSF
ncbi:hypothetical protein YC2023_075837 [Brassica napus]